MSEPTPIELLLRDGPRVVNLGIREFAESLAAQAVPVVHVDWKPPPAVDADVEAVLEQIG